MTSRRHGSGGKDLLAILDQILSSELIMVDGGAKGGTRELLGLAKYVAAYAFEPNPIEFDRIIDNLSRLESSLYKKMTYLPLALLEHSGEATLYITKRPGATSTLRPNTELLTHFERDNWSQMREIVAQEVVQGISLADFIAQENLPYIDYVKLDTQGNELPILQSAKDFLQNISVIKTEVELIPLYRGQPLLGDVCGFLTGRDFQLIDLQWTDPCRRYHFSPHLPNNSYRLVWAEAIFAYDPLNFSKTRSLEQAIILAELGYLDVGLYIISQIPSVNQTFRDALLSYYQQASFISKGKWLKSLLKRYLPEPWIEAYRVLKQNKTRKEVPRVP